MSKKIINWGIIGTGKSAHNFAKALLMIETGKLAAVASRSQSKAKSFARAFNLPLYFSSYERLANNSEIDIVYIATPNSCHKDNAELCLNAGKNVLIEKPFTTNTIDSKILINLAKKNNLFLMEAMWTRFIPAFNKVEQLIKSGEIGEVMSFHGTLGQVSEIDKSNNLFNGSMSGGATLDLGVYLVFWAYYLFGSPINIQSDIYCGGTDVDLTASTILSYGQGKYAHISSSIITRFSNSGVIYGTKGAIEVYQPLYCPTAISVIKYSNASSMVGHRSTLSKTLLKIKHIPLLQNLYINHPLLGQLIFRNTVKKTINMPINGNGLQYMAEEVSSYLLNKKTIEGKVIPLSETIAIMKIIDKIKATPDIVLES